MDDRSKHDHTGWDAVVLAARERARSRQALMVEHFGLPGDVQYDWSMDDAQITWSRDGKVFLTGRLTVIGSVSVAQQTWLWSWANGSLPHAALGDIEQVRQFGEENDYPVLPGQASTPTPDLSLRHEWSRPPCSTQRGCGQSPWTTFNSTLWFMTWCSLPIDSDGCTGISAADAASLGRSGEQIWSHPEHRVADFRKRHQRRHEQRSHALKQLVNVRRDRRRLGREGNTEVQKQPSRPAGEPLDDLDLRTPTGGSDGGSDTLSLSRSGVRRTGRPRRVGSAGPSRSSLPGAVRPTCGYPDAALISPCRVTGRLRQA